MVRARHRDGNRQRARAPRAGVKRSLFQRTDQKPSQTGQAGQNRERGNAGVENQHAPAEVDFIMQGIAHHALLKQKNVGALL
jgi:hypothetical protein